MGFDLDLAVSHPRSGFQKECATWFERVTQAVHRDLVLAPLNWSEHAHSMGKSTFAVPLLFEDVFGTVVEAQAVTVISAHGALAVDELVLDLLMLDDGSWWKYQDLMPSRPGEPYRGYKISNEGFPNFSSRLGNVQHLLRVMTLTKKYEVCVACS